MKYIVSLIIGILAGMATFVFVFYNNPFVGRAELSPLAVSESGLNNLSYSAVTTQAIMYTNNGESISRPHPGKIAELWEPTVEQSEVLITRLIDSRGMLAGIGVKMSSPSHEKLGISQVDPLKERAIAWPACFQLERKSSHFAPWICLWAPRR